MNNLQASLRAFQAASKAKLSDLLKDAVDPDTDSARLTEIKKDMVQLLKQRDGADAIYDFLKAMKQANVSVPEALAFITRL